jgi:hypothetical protein
MSGVPVGVVSPSCGNRACRCPTLQCRFVISLGGITKGPNQRNVAKVQIGAYMSRTVEMDPATQPIQQHSKRKAPVRRLLCLLLLSDSFLLGQRNSPNSTDQNHSNGSKGQITVQGCVDRARGDYILVQQDPGMTYELEAKGKIKLRQYLGQQVEVTGTKSPSLSTSSDTLTNSGSPAPVTLRIISIRTIAKECSAHQVPN